MREKHENLHHILPKSRGWNWEPENIVKIEVNLHAAYHRLFENDMPHEAMQRLLYFNRTALQKEYYEKVMSVLDWSTEYIYKWHLLIPKR